ncbi:fimbria/pilus outer membrane usher protein [Enterobacter roggenkampii]
MRIPFRLSAAAVLINATCIVHAAHAQKYTFDASLLSAGGQEVDLSLFNEGVQLPGIYNVDILFNGDLVDSQDVKFSVRREAGHSTLYPCLSVEQLSSYGVRTEDFAALEDSSGCANLAGLPGASYDFLFSQQQLQLSVPQIHLRPSGRGLAPRSLWNDGIPAFLMNYTASSNHAESKGSVNQDSTFVQITPGLNLGAWRLRNNSNWQKQGARRGRWQTTQTYAERGLYDQKNSLSLGDRISTDSVFDSIPFRGVMLASDELMVPYAERAYAPIVRGIARTQARVEVSQNGYTLYNTTVAPGPFALTDFSLAGSSGGDLEVQVHETDGTVQVLRIPYQMPPLALKERYLSYSVLAGRYRPAHRGVDEPLVGQASLMYGLPYGLTVYGGAQGAKHYHSAALGLGASLGEWGGTSLDIVGSRAHLRGHDQKEGAAWRLRYNKTVTATKTTFSLTSYRHATQGFATLQETLNSYGSAGGDRPDWFTRYSSKMRSTTSAAVSQSMGRAGNLALNYSRSDYWHRGVEDTSYSVSYSIGLLADISATLSHSRVMSLAGSSRGNEQMTSLWLSVPLNSLTGNKMMATYQASLSSARETHSAGLSGDALDRQLNWDVRQGLLRQQEIPIVSSTYGSARWKGAYGEVGGSYSHSSGQRSVAAEIAGGMVLHRNGLTLGQPFSGSVALIAAQGADGVPVYSMPGVKTDFRGYALHSSLTPYQENVVSLDPLGLPDNVEITQTDIRVVPTNGAVVPASFGTRSGRRGLMTLVRTDGTPVPFGSLVTVVGAEGNAGVVGSGGEVYLTGLPERGALQVKWKQGQCNVQYTLENLTVGVHSEKASCR